MNSFIQIFGSQTILYLLQAQQMKVQSKYPLGQLFKNLEPFLRQPSAFSQNKFDEQWYNDVIYCLESEEVLVVGAGGLGCQIVKNLALSGIRKIHLIDMDTIDLTNLNRQFLFRHKDINKKKAQVVANFVMRRCPGVQVIPHCCRVQEKQYSFYTRFHVIIGGLDNIQARKYLNSVVHQLNEDQQTTQCIYIDGATEGFEGQCVVVEPFKTSCYNCTLLDGLTNQPKANYCTIANTPRSPEHCIQYVLEIEWEKQFPNTKRDNDNLEHMNWIYEKSLERAKNFKIEGVTEMLTLGLAKNIIPAIASTNAFVAAFSTNQAIKYLMRINPKLDNFFYYRGGTSASSDSQRFAKKLGCMSCESRANKLKPLEIQIEKSALFPALLAKIHEKNPVISLQPFVNINQKMFYNPIDTSRKALKDEKKISQLQQQNIFTQNPQEIVVTDNSLKSQQRIFVKVIEDLPVDEQKL